MPKRLGAVITTVVFASAGAIAIASSHDTAAVHRVAALRHELPVRDDQRPPEVIDLVRHLERRREHGIRDAEDGRESDHRPSHRRRHARRVQCAGLPMIA